MLFKIISIVCFLTVGAIIAYHKNLNDLYIPKFTINVVIVLFTILGTATAPFKKEIALLFGSATITIFFIAFTVIKNRKKQEEEL